MDKLLNSFMGKEVKILHTASIQNAGINSSSMQLLEKTLVNGADANKRKKCSSGKWTQLPFRHN